jgi:predicted transcriptional regulator
MTVEQIKKAVLKMTPSEQRRLLGFVENLLEDRLEMTDKFKSEIDAGKADIAEGRVRVRRP